MKKDEVLHLIRETGVIAVIRAESEQRGEALADAVQAGGIRALEITMTVPGALELIKKLSDRYRGTDVLIGAGTVLDAETARACILNGAQFVVSPAFNGDTIRLCNRYGIAVVPGVMTVTEAVEALESGVQILKLFPANAYGPSILKAFHGPLPQAEFIPTGGVSIENCGQWIKAGAAAVGSGGELTKGDDYAAITERAARFVKAVADARVQMTGDAKS